MSLLEKALIKAEAIKVATSYLTDEQAETVTTLFSKWETGKAYEIGDRV